MTEQEYTLRRDLLRDAIRKQRAELGQLEQDLNELEQEWNMLGAFRRIVEERVTQSRGVVVTPISTNAIYGAYTSKPEVSQ